MAKQFKKIIMASSNEVSLCSKYNSGANKQTEFELIKDKEGNVKSDCKLVLKQLLKYVDFYDDVIETEHPDSLDKFKDFLNYWIEYDVNNCLYTLLSESLQNALYDIKEKDLTKEEKVQEYQKLFNLFIEEYINMPITKNKDGKYEVSLVSTSHIQECGTNPQNETADITKEKTSEMKTEEQKTMFEQALDLLKSAFGCLEKTETPAEETQEIQPPVEAEEAEAPAETPAEEVQEEGVEEEIAKAETEETPAEEVQEEGEPAEVEAPVVEPAEVETVEEPVEEVAEETQEEVVEEAPAEIEKSGESIEEIMKQKLDLEKELDELRKAQAEKEETIEKMTFIQKAKDEFSMLVGTPEEIGEKLYSISKSNLDADAKEFIMEQLKKVSVENGNLTDELGSNTKDAGDLTDEEVIYQKAENIAKTKGISVKKALREIK